MNIVKLLSFLLRAVYIEVVEPELPEPWKLLLTVPERQRALGGSHMANVFSQIAGDALLQDLYDYGRRSS